MRTRRRLKKEDYYRVILTETLPYETPYIFSNELFYEYLVSHNNKKVGKTENIVNQIIGIGKDYYNGTVPLKYTIRHSTNKIRELSIMHPHNQHQFVKFYEKYGMIILHLCSRSKISIRYPDRIASMYYEQSGNEDTYPNGTPSDIDRSNSSLFVSSYFTIERYNRFYKFYDSREFLQLEKKYSHLIELDVSKCFSSLYTHTIDWAIKSKVFAKEYKYNNFGAAFDEIMNKSNWCETNGILIGPEISRLFAEIVLQRIDQEIEQSLKRDEIRFDVHYTIRRYVDDYLVFTHDVKIGEKVSKVIELELSKYNLHLNESKTMPYVLPYLSDMSIAKKQLSQILTTLFEDAVNIVNDPLADKVSMNLNRKLLSIKETNLIDSIKCVAHSNCLHLQDLSMFSLAILSKKLNLFIARVCKPDIDYTDENASSIHRVLFNLLKVVFYLFSFDYRITASFSVYPILINIVSYYDTSNLVNSITVKKYIRDECVHLINKILKNDGAYIVENLSIISTLKLLGDEYLLDESILMNVLSATKQDIGSVYFVYMVLLHYIEDNPKYESLRHTLVDSICDHLSSCKYNTQYAEVSMMLIDFLRCPYIDLAKRTAVFKEYYRTKNGDRNINRISSNAVSYIVSHKLGFIHWEERIVNLERLRKKKKYNAY